MSWGLGAFNISADYKTVADLPPGFKPDPIGSRDEVRQAIVTILPSVDVSDPRYVVYQDQEGVIEFSIGDSEICESLGVRIVGGGDPIPIIDRIFRSLNVRGVDYQTGDFFSIETSVVSHSDWKQFRDSVIPTKEEPPTTPHKNV